MMAKITKRTVDASKPDAAGRRYYIWDAELKGFGLLVLPSGVKSYFYRYRTPEGRERRATIGKHGAWTPDEARKKADEFARTVREGGDPLGEKVAAREALTVDSLLDQYLESARFAEKAESTRAIDQGRIARHLRPLLGKSYVSKLRTEDIRKAFRDIRDGKTAGNIKTKKRGVARVRGGETTARDTIGLFRAILNWAMGEGMISDNPANVIKLPASGQRDTILEGPKDYERLFKTLDKMETERRLRAPVADAIRVIALTGARRGEIAGLRWGHVDQKAGRLVIPPASHKTGRKTGKPRIIELPTVAQAIIAKQAKGGAGDYVFPPAGGEGPIQLSRPWRTIRVEAELPDGIGLHGLRHALASHMAMDGAQAAEIMTALGHRQLSTAQKYVHWADSQRRKLADRAASVAIAGLNAATDGESAEVVPIKDRGNA